MKMASTIGRGLLMGLFGRPVRAAACGAASADGARGEAGTGERPTGQPTNPRPGNTAASGLGLALQRPEIGGRLTIPRCGLIGGRNSEDR